MKFLRDFNFKNKRVLVRVDFNVSLKSGQIFNDFRIKATLPTIKYLVEKKAKVILLSHFGRPDNSEKYHSLKIVSKRLSFLLNQEIGFLDKCFGAEVKRKIEQIKPGNIVLLENLRFYKEEEKNDTVFAKQIADLGEIYVNDAFGVIHRSHASIVGLPKYLPCCAGLLLEKEIKNLSNVLDKSRHPLLVIIGGAKISTKIKLIKKFLQEADNLILGGALANTVISAKGFAIGRSIIEEKMIDEVKKLKLTNTKLHIPVDVVVSSSPCGKKSTRVAPIGNTKENEMILDIGPDTIQLFQKIINQSKTIIWNGPMGLFEIEKFSLGSKNIAMAVANSSAFSVVGGGDTITLLQSVNLLKNISHISTGGGAMLKFLAGEKLPGIEALN
ncbi:MAG: phosphoglycerate kinase [bacterium]